MRERDVKRRDTQRKQTFSGYTVRKGVAISMEHNFMMSPEGMKNFHNQITQVVGSIQVTNDLDVHMALLNARISRIT